MNVFTRGLRNAFRNMIRTFSIVAILGLSMGLAIAMLVAHAAVGKKIDSVKSSVGNTVSISPAGARGFEGGGTALTAAQLAKVANISHVTSIDKSLSDRLTTSNTNLKSAVEAGSLGQRNAGNNGQSFMPPGGGTAPTDGGGAQNTGTTTQNNASTAGTVSFTPPVTLVGTTNPSGAIEGAVAIKSGAAFSGTSTENVALIGSALATKNNLKVGSTFTAYGKTVKVVGIFDAGNTFSNNQLLMPLAAVQTLSSQSGAITSATVHVDSITNVESVTTVTKTQLGTAADVTNAAAQAETTVAPLENIQTISLYSLIGAVAAGAVIVLLTMVMIVRERRREIGVLKAIGASNLKVMTQFAAEAVTLTGLAAVLGTVIGFVAGSPITKMLVTNASSSATTAAGPGGGRMGGGFSGLRNSVTNVQATVGWEVLLYGLGAAIVIAIVGSVLASFFIAKVRPADVMRAE